MTTATPQEDAETTIMFLDDEEAVLEALYLMCGDEFRVLTARTGEEALTQFGEHVDIAFFDRQLPETTGDDVLRTIREQGYTTPVAILSAVERDHDLEAAYDDYLMKPIDADQIATTIETHTA